MNHFKNGDIARWFLPHPNLQKGRGSVGIAIESIIKKRTTTIQ
jgi:hypothetical protein